MSDGDGDGLRPIDAVLSAQAFLRKYLADLNTACATPHEDVSRDHRDQFGPVGLRVFRPEVPPAERCCLLDCTIDYVRIAERKPQFDVGVRLIPAPSLPQDGGTIEPDRILRSVIEIDMDSARVHIVKQLNECWRRFACAKELGQLIMGFGENRGTITFNPQVQLQMAFKIGDTDIDWNNDVSREVFAWLMAIELMLPYWHRQCLHRQIERGVDALTIAQHFRVPKSVIDMYAETAYGKKSWEVLSSVIAEEFRTPSPGL